MTALTPMAIEITDNFPVAQLTGFSLLKLRHEEVEGQDVIRFALEYDGVCQDVMTARASEGVGKIRGRLHKMDLREVAGYILREVAFRHVLDRFAEPAVLESADLFEKAVRRLHPRTINTVQLEEFLRAIKMTVSTSSRARKSTK